MNAHRLTLALAFSLAFLSLAASAPKAHAQQFAYCKADAERLCAGIPPGGGRLAKCLKAHENEVSIGCGKELKKVRSEMGSKAATIFGEHFPLRGAFYRRPTGWRRPAYGANGVYYTVAPVP